MTKVDIAVFCSDPAYFLSSLSFTHIWQLNMDYSHDTQ